MSREIQDFSVRGHRVIVRRWHNDQYTDPLDITQWIEAGAWGYESWSMSGVRRQTGKLILMGYPFPTPPESLDPRKNPRRWKRGNQGTIEVWENEQWLKVATFYLLRFPIPASPDDPSFEVEIGCKLALLDYRVPPEATEEHTEVDMGTPTPLLQVVGGLLRAAGIDSLEGSIGGTLDFSPYKNFSSSWVEEAGKLAYAFGSYLRCNADDQVIAVPMPDLYAMSRFKAIRLGHNEGKCVPIGNGEPVAEKLVITGVATQVMPTPNRTVTVEEDYAPASAFQLGAVGNVVARQAITVEEGITVRKRNTIVREPVGAVRPRAIANRLALTTSSIEDESKYFGGGAEGRLYKSSLMIQEPLAKSLAEMNVSDPGLKVSVREATSYSYDEQAGASEISVFRQEQAGRIAPKSFATFGIVDPETALSPDDLVPSGGQIETWRGDHDVGMWRYRQRTYDNANRKYDLKFVPLQTRLSNIVVSSKGVTSNAGGAQPPQAERRSPLFFKKETPLETEIELEPVGGTAFSPREETIDVPYAQTESQLQKAALPYAVSKVGRDLSIQWELPPDSDWFSDPDPVLRLDVAELDGTVFAYWVDNLSFAFDQERFYVGGDGIYLGLVDTESLDPEYVPGSEEIPGSGPGRVRSPYVRRINFAVRGGSAGRIFSSPIPLIAKEVVFAVRGGSAGRVRLQLPPIDFAVRGGSAVIGAPVLQFPVRSGSAGVLELESDNIAQPSLTLKLQATGMSQFFIDPEFPTDLFLTTWLNEDGSGTSMKAFESYGSAPFYAENFFGLGLHAAAFREAEHYGSSNQAMQDSTFVDFITPRRRSNAFITATACTVFLVLQLDTPVSNSNVPSSTEESDGWIGTPADSSPSDRDQILSFGSMAIASKRLYDPDTFEEYFKIWLLHQEAVTYDRWRLASDRVSAGVPLLITVWHELGTLYLQVNNGAIASTTNAAGATADLSTNQLTIGGFANDSFAGKLGTVLAYNASLDAVTREAIQDQLNTLYGIWS